jgi:hypothetical protein
VVAFEIGAGLPNQESRNQRDTAERLAALGFEAVANSPTEFAERIETDIVKWAQVIQAANIKGE